MRERMQLRSLTVAHLNGAGVDVPTARDDEPVRESASFTVHLVNARLRQTRHVLKALAHMNVQLYQVIAGVRGEAGQPIVRMILAGERNLAALAKLRHARIQADKATIVESLFRSAKHFASWLWLCPSTKISGRHDKSKAICATVYKFARLIYALLTHGNQYADQREAYHGKRYRKRVQYHPKCKALAMSFVLTSVEMPA